MRQFVMTEPHITAMKKFEEWAGEGSAFVDWTNSSSLIDWEEAMTRLQNPTFITIKEKHRQMKLFWSFHLIF